MPKVRDRARRGARESALMRKKVEPPSRQLVALHGLTNLAGRVSTPLSPVLPLLSAGRQATEKLDHHSPSLVTRWNQHQER
jgi:hypothetical protein